MSLTEFTKVATLSELPEGGMLGVIAEDVEICIARIGGELFAIDNICSHYYTWLSMGELFTDACEVQCPMHDSRFSLRTGRPHQPPANMPVEVYAVRVEAEDILVGPKE